MKNIPPEIFLQIDADGETPEDFKDLQVTWCVDRIYENDLRYVHEDLVKKEALAFWVFKDDYQRIEGMNHRHWSMETYGTPVSITWRGDSDEKIWEAYKKGEQIKRYYEK